jgi:hypothetical protein
METESDNAISFLDVLVIRKETALATLVYRKPTHTGHRSQTVEKNVKILNFLWLDNYLEGKCNGLVPVTFPELIFRHRERARRTAVIV